MTTPRTLTQAQSNQGNTDRRMGDLPTIDRAKQLRRALRIDALRINEIEASIESAMDGDSLVSLGEDLTRAHAAREAHLRQLEETLSPAASPSPHQTLAGSMVTNAATQPEIL